MRTSAWAVVAALSAGGCNSALPLFSDGGAADSSVVSLPADSATASPDSAGALADAEGLRNASGAADAVVPVDAVVPADAAEPVDAALAKDAFVPADAASRADADAAGAPKDADPGNGGGIVPPGPNALATWGCPEYGFGGEAPSLSGSVWIDVSKNKGSPQVQKHELLPSGVIRYTYIQASNPGAVYENGVWSQTWDCVRMSFNNNYAVQLGRIADGRIVGAGANIAGQRWTWQATPAP